MMDSIMLLWDGRPAALCRQYYRGEGDLVFMASCTDPVCKETLISGLHSFPTRLRSGLAVRIKHSTVVSWADRVFRAGRVTRAPIAAAWLGINATRSRTRRLRFESVRLAVFDRLRKTVASEDSGSEERRPAWVRPTTKRPPPTQREATERPATCLHQMQKKSGTTPAKRRPSNVDRRSAHSPSIRRACASCA